MFSRMSAGISLTRQAANVLRLDQELMLFPVLSGLACLLVTLSFYVPLAALGLVDTMSEERFSREDGVLVSVLGFLFYFANYFVIVFFNAALVGCAVIRLRGGDPNVGHGLSVATKRLPRIVGWALVGATVGILLKSFEGRDNRSVHGQIIVGLLGTTWTLLTFFVLPAIVVENLGPFAAMRRSSALLRGAWGEAITSTFSVRLLTFLVMLVGLIPLVVGGVLTGNGVAALGVPLVIIGVALLLGISVVSTALMSVVLAALYLYAVDGEAPGKFDPDLLEHAFAAE